MLRKTAQKQSGTQKAGSALGEALGGKLGKKFLSRRIERIAKGFGQFAEPLGGVIDGVVGSFLGGLFSKANWGLIDLASGSASAVTGNSGTSQKVARATGDSFTDALKDLANLLGGTVSDCGAICSATSCVIVFPRRFGRGSTRSNKQRDALRREDPKDK